MFRRPYLYFFLAILSIYLILNIAISGFYNTIPLIIVYASTVNWLKLGFSLLLTVIIGVLVSLNVVLIYDKYKERKKCDDIRTASVGAIGGLIVGVCPLCVSGVFPIILSLIGVSFSFGSLPFQGIEIQAFVLLILLISLINISKK